MSSFSQHKRASFRFLAPLLGIALLVYLALRIDPRGLLEDAKTIGWGILLVFGLAGISHIVKTCAWRLILRGEAQRVSFARSLGLRLVSEAIGQLGFVGMVFGETARVCLLGPNVPVANGISSATLDRSLFVLSGAVVTIVGILCAILTVALPHVFRIYAAVLITALLCLLIAAAVCVCRRLPLFSGAVRTAARLPWFRRWLHNKEAMLESAEEQIVQFHREAPIALFASVVLNFLCHGLAIMEVYLILHLLGAPVSLVGALVLESLTKLINVIGAINPGNLGTYEAGNMIIGRLLRLSAAEGLTLGMCRRVRALFWAFIGCVCFFWLSRLKSARIRGSAPEMT